MPPTTTAQERGLAFAPMPFATLSFFSSSYVIYHLLFQKRKKLERMYHRLILALNFTLILFSVCYVWAPFAVPEGTAHKPFAAGTIQTCTAQGTCLPSSVFSKRLSCFTNVHEMPKISLNEGFIFVTCLLASPVYYGSLSAQAYLSIKNNFKEEKYKWIEKWSTCSLVYIIHRLRVGCSYLVCFSLWTPP